MAKLRSVQTENQRERHREAQRRYRERYARPITLRGSLIMENRFREQIAHRARRANTKKNAEEGKTTVPRPKARQYWSDPEQDSEEEEEQDEW